MLMFDTVRKSKNAALVGVSGIVVQETENTFKVVTRKDKLKGACASPLLPSCLLSVYLSLLYLSPQNFFLQFCQSKGLSLPLRFLYIAQNYHTRQTQRLVLVLEQIQGRKAAVVVLMVMVMLELEGMMIYEKQEPCWMVHILSSNCMVTSSVSAPRIGLDESSSTRRPSSSDAIGRPGRARCLRVTYLFFHSSYSRRAFVRYDIWG